MNVHVGRALNYKGSGNIIIQYDTSGRIIILICSVKKKNQSLSKCQIPVVFLVFLDGPHGNPDKNSASPGFNPNKQIMPKPTTNRCRMSKAVIRSLLLLAPTKPLAQTQPIRPHHTNNFFPPSLVYIE